jgi:hypothetical protein
MVGIPIWSAHSTLTARALPVEHGPCQVLIKAECSGFEPVDDHLVATLEPLPIEIESLGCGFPTYPTPAVAEEHSS